MENITAMRHVPCAMRRGNRRAIFQRLGAIFQRLGAIFQRLGAIFQREWCLEWQGVERLLLKE